MGTFFALIFISVIGLDFLVDPHDAALNGGPSGYFAGLAALIIALPMLVTIFLIRRRFPALNLFETVRRVLGGPLAAAGNLFFLTPFFLWLVITVQSTGEVVVGYLLEQTPLGVVTASMLAGMVYLALNGLKAVSRFAAFVLIPTVVLRFLLWMLAIQNASLDHLLPVFSNSFQDYLRGGIGLANFYLPYATIFLIYPLVENKKKIAAATWSAVGINTFLFLIAITGTIAIFGAEMTVKFNFPALEAVRMINLPYLIIEEPGLFFLILWLTTYFTGIAYYLQTVAGGLKQIIPRVNYRITVVMLAGIVWVAGFFIPNAFLTVDWFNLLRRWVIAPVTVYPLLILFIAAITGKKGARS